MAMLRAVEALRLHAAAHDEELPASLEDVTQVPIPVDPCSWKPYQYELDQETATLVAEKVIYPESRMTIEIQQTSKRPQ